MGVAGVLALALVGCGGGMTTTTSTTKTTASETAVIGGDTANKIGFKLLGSLLQMTRISRTSAGVVGTSFTVICVTDLQLFAADLTHLPTSNPDVAEGRGRWGSANTPATVRLSRVLPTPADACFVSGAQVSGVIGYFNAGALGIVQAAENSQASSAQEQKQAQLLLASARIGALRATMDGHFPPASVLATDILSARKDLLDVRTASDVAGVIAVNIPYVVGDVDGSTSVQLAVRVASGTLYAQRFSARP
jgi:hypothetical protein